MLELLTQSSWADRIGWMLVHSLWQFALLAVVAAGLQWALHRCTSAARYRALLVAMCLLVALPVATWFWTGPAEVPVARADARLMEEPQERGLWHPPRVQPPQYSDDMPVSEARPAPAPVERTGPPRSEPLPPEPSQASSPPLLSSLQETVQPWLPQIVLIWLAGVLLAALRPLFSWYTVHRLKTVGISPVGEAVQVLVEHTAARLGVTRAVRVLQSTLVKAPAVVGHFRPAILLPLCVLTGLPEPQLELILAHELAHIRRNDYLVNLLQTLVETLFFYHPAVWWLSRQIRNERENCCDDVAMALGASRVDYGRALLAVEQLRAARAGFSLAAGGGSLVSRIRRIAGCEPAPRIVGSGSILGIVLVSLVLLAGVTRDTAPAIEKPEQPVAATGTDAPVEAADDVPAVDAWEPGQTIDVQAIHAETKEPLPGVKLEFQYHGPGIDFQDVKTKTTDADGRAQFTLPDLRPDAVRIDPTKPGFVLLRVYWGDDLPSPKLPKSVTIPLQPGAEWHREEIRRVAGDQTAAMTPTVYVPAVLSFQVEGQTITRPVELIGIDPETQGDVSDFSKYLQHPANRKKFSLDLRPRGYALIKRDKLLTVANISEGIPDGLAPQVELDDLANHGEFEFVTVHIPLGEQDATSLLSKLRAIKGAHGKIVPLPDTRQLRITDTARIIKTMVALVKGDAGSPVTEKVDDQAAADGAWQPGQTIDVQVIHAETKEPLPGVTLNFQYHGPGIDFQDITTKVTDAQGRSQAKLPDLRPDGVRIYPSKAGFVPLRVYWGDDLPSPKLPKAVTIPMQPGTVWGGVVQNENGEPIENVEVNVHYWEKRSEFNPHLRVNIGGDIGGVTTDQEGRWQLDIMPAKVDEDGPLVFLTHPDYVSDHLERGRIPKPVTERPSYEALRAQTAVMVMRKGGTIEGRVIDEAGQPVSGARIHTKDRYWSDSGKPAATTGEDGRFRIANLSFKHSELNDPPPSTSRSIELREIAITVQADGYTPELVHADPNGSTSPLEITLKPGQAVVGQITDESGKPLEGVSVSASNWLGYRSRLNLRTETVADGKFRLADAPSSDALYDFYKKGYMAIEGFSMSPQPTEQPGNEGYQITLRLPVRIAGSIVDAETNKPLAKCWLMLSGYAKQLGSRGKAITDGRYEIVLNREQWLTQIRVEADGYKPAVSRHFKPYDPDRGLVTYDFRMTKAVPTKAVAMAGTVLGLDGQPLSDAEVFLAKQQFFVEHGTASPEARRTSRTVKTDAQGRFEFTPEAEPFYLVVLHEQGHIVLDEKQFALTPTVRIEPWRSAERTLMVRRNQSSYAGSAPENDQRTLNVRIVDAAGNPVEGATVASAACFYAGYNYLGDNEAAWDYFANATSDQYGRARVAHFRNCVVARHVERKLVAIQRIGPEQVKSSEIVTITMEPQCKVFGNLTATELEARNGKIEWSQVSVSLGNRRVRPMSCQSNRDDFHFYLPPGTYQLEAYANDTQHARKTITVMRTITVNPGQQELEVEPIDLPPTGLVLLEGKPAPELRDVVAWKNGEPVKLSDLKGKVVVLAFSSHWVADRPHEWMPNLFTICDKYGDQGLALVHIRLGPMPIIGIDSQVKLDERIAEVKSPFWDDRDLPIPIALGLWNRPTFLRNEEEKKANEYLPCAILKDYGVNALNSLPTGVLIDRQGRIVGEFDLRSDKDNAVLEKLLKEK